MEWNMWTTVRNFHFATVFVEEATNMQRILMLSTLVVTIILSSNVQARQQVLNHRGREVVVHTNPIPVLLHRLVPPNHGRHITLQEYRAGKLPRR